jgi:hypothetical protein
MNHKFTTTFLKSLIDSDFSLVKSRKTPNHFNSKIQLDTLNQFNVVNILELNKTLKQFSKFLFLLKQQKNKNYCIYVLCEDKFLNALLTKLCIELVLNTNIIVSETLPLIKHKTNTINAALILGDLSYNYKNILEKNLFFNNIFIVHKINTKYEKNFLGFYKIYNDITDLKKIIFLVILMSKILNTIKLDNAKI